MIVPTTRGRGRLLEWSVGSALSQSLDDVEIFIVGDGLGEDDVACVKALMAADERISLYEFPKGERRGEANRHDLLLNEANGDIVAYLTDRDLWRPNHLMELRSLLDTADFAHTLRVGVGPDENIEVIWRSDLSSPAVQARHRELSILVPLSFVGHTMNAYRRLPHGWRTTPEGQPTDHYMWQQFLDQPWCRVAGGAVPTVLYFKRGDHPGLSADERRALLEDWTRRSAEPGFDAAWTRQITAALIADRSELVERLANRPIDHLRRLVPTSAQSALANSLPRETVAALRNRLDGSRLG